MNGLSRKIGKVTDFIKFHKIDVLMVQETHVFQTDIITQHLERNGLSILINKKRNTLNNYDGTAFIVNKKVVEGFSLQSCILQDNRLQKLTLISNQSQESFSLYNVYMKTGNNILVKRQRLHTLQILEKDLGESVSVKLIVGGDFNFITNRLDTNSNNNEANKKLAEEVDAKKWIGIIKQHKLKDCYRKQFKNGRAYTKISKRCVARRIDRLYSTEHIVNYNHIPIGFSDHCSSPGVLLRISSFVKWGQGFWKLNSNLLDKHSIKSLEDMWQGFKMYDGNCMNILNWWDVMKIRVKKFYMIIGKQRSKNNKDLILQKQDEINKMITNLTKEELQDNARYTHLKKEVLNYERMKVNRFHIQHKI